jgi:riboflavin kinase/FMN adenylyltransferase
MAVLHGSSSGLPVAAGAVTIGNFDGVHRGHRELLRRTVEYAASAGIPSVAVTFSPHPVRHFSPDSRFYEITTPEERAALIAETGIEFLLVEPFNEAIGSMTPEAFARDFLVGRLHTRHLVVGYDFNFGAGRAGSPSTLVGLGRGLGFTVDVVPALYRGGAIVSSSRIRELLLGGRVREAEDLLCRPYRLSGTVVTGAQRGHKLGFPTANVRFRQELAPLPGVYLVEAEVDGKRARGVANIGFNPTFGDNSLGLEVHLLGDPPGDLYGKEMAVDFHDRLRDERKFESVDALVRQIAEDVRQARQAAARLPTGKDSGESGE